MLYQLSYTPRCYSGAFAAFGGCPFATIPIASLNCSRLVLRKQFLFLQLLFQNLRHDAGADGAAAFADGEAQLLFHGDRNDQFHFH